MPSANQDLADGMVDNRLALLQYEAGATARVVLAYEDALRSINRDLIRLAKSAETGDLNTAERIRLMTLRQEVTDTLVALKPVLEAQLQTDLMGAARLEASVVQKLLDLNTPGNATVTSLSRELVEAMVVQPIGGKVWTDRMAVDLLEEHDAIQRSLAESVALGRSMDDAAVALRNGTAVIETYRGRMVSIARTEIQRVANSVALETFRQNSDVVGRVLWLATLDSRTCLVCAPRHMQVYELNDVEPPPLHPRCRCALAPVTKSWSELGLPVSDRNRYNGQPPKEMDFEQWLKRQPEERQRDVLGATRWAVWTKGDLKLAAFSSDNKVLTLDELADRYGVDVP